MGPGCPGAPGGLGVGHELQMAWDMGCRGGGTWAAERVGHGLQRAWDMGCRVCGGELQSEQGVERWEHSSGRVAEHARCGELGAQICVWGGGQVKKLQGVWREPGHSGAEHARCGELGAQFC
eukprot:313849-Chlamydomonas_euryale.AAC.2